MEIFVSGERGTVGKFLQLRRGARVGNLCEKLLIRERCSERGEEVPHKEVPPSLSSHSMSLGTRPSTQGLFTSL